MHGEGRSTGRYDGFSVLERGLTPKVMTTPRFILVHVQHTAFRSKRLIVHWAERLCIPQFFLSSRHFQSRMQWFSELIINGHQRTVHSSSWGISFFSTKYLDMRSACPMRFDAAWPSFAWQFAVLDSWETIAHLLRMAPANHGRDITLVFFCSSTSK